MQSLEVTKKPRKDKKKKNKASTLKPTTSTPTITNKKKSSPGTNTEL